MIRLNNITFGYGDKLILEELSLEVSKGDWLGLLGPNGAGKTTLLKLISGELETKDHVHSGSGRKFSSTPGVDIGGRSITKYSRKEAAKLIALVPQSSEFTFPFSALEVVLMGRAPYLKQFGFETKEDIKIAQEAMEKTDSWQFKSRPIDELSGGERQRVIIARALAQEPRILLLDEPTSFLDIKHQIGIMEIISELNKEGLTVISALHDINLAISYCEEIALLHNGKIEKRGSPKEIVTYKNLKEVFGTEVYVGENEFSGLPYYVPMGGVCHPERTK